jgi:hypothetical protein
VLPDPERRRVTRDDRWQSHPQDCQATRRALTHRTDDGRADQHPVGGARAELATAKIDRTADRIRWQPRRQRHAGSEIVDCVIAQSSRSRRLLVFGLLWFCSSDGSSTSGSSGPPTAAYAGSEMGGR